MHQDTKEKELPNQRKAHDVTGLYVSGWLKRGPRWVSPLNTTNASTNSYYSGIIATNKWDAEETAQTLLSDWKQMQVDNTIRHLSGFKSLRSTFSDKGIRTVSFDEWKQIEEEERKRGKEKGKPLEKITIVGDMLEIISPHWSLQSIAM